MDIFKPARFRLSRRGWIVVAVGALLVSSYMADSVASIGRVRSGVRAGSLQLAGKTQEEARALLNARAQLLLSQRVELYADTRRVSVGPSQIGFQPDIGSTLRKAMGVGRTGNFFVRLWQRVRALFASTDVGWLSGYDKPATSALVAQWADGIDTDGHEAGIEARGDTIVPVGAVPGRKLDRAAAVQVVVDGLQTWPRRSMELPIAVQPRHTDIDDARRAAEEANHWARAPIVVLAPDSSRITLSRIKIASMLQAVSHRHASGWSLDVEFDPAQVSDALSAAMHTFERDARNASFSVGSALVTIQPSQDGQRFNPRETGAELARAAQADPPRTATAKFSATKPDLTTESAKGLRIKELVSSYTTHHPCCAARVQNIHRMADTVDGAIVHPGEQFSLNAYVGERSADKGYVLAPMIYDGKYKDEFGGGVSQFATTTFNAIFYGGYQVDTHTPHSYYISRYPAGRDATISWPQPDLKFTNDSNAGILIKTAYTGTSLTVSFYGDKEGRAVRDETGPRTNLTEPATQYEVNAALVGDQQHVKQAGEQGFDIVVTRVITANGKERRERFFTRYDAEPRIIEVAPGKAPCQTPPPGTAPTPCPTAPPSSPPPDQPSPTPQRTPHQH